VELRHLRYFVAVAEELHFGRAAQRLDIVQPALSKQIVALERELGVTLFVRTKRAVSITEAGRALYAEARDILQRADHAADTAKLVETGALGSLAIGFIGPAMWNILPSLMREHRSRFPGMHFRLLEMTSGVIIQQLRDGILDAGFIRPFGHDEALEIRTVWSEPLVVVVPESHPLAREDVVDLADAADETFVLVSRAQSPGLFDQCLALCQSYGFSPLSIQEGNTGGAMFGMVAAGLGVTLVPESSAVVPWPGVAFRPLTKTEPQLELAIAYRRDNDSSWLAAFLDTVDAVLAELEAAAHGRNGDSVTARS
jgi:DNA-binding transcriptional LysR family regulator